MRFEGHGSIARHGLPWPVAFGVGLLLVLFAMEGIGLSLASLALALVVGATFLLTMLGKPTKAGAKRRITADAEGLKVDRELVMPRRAIQGGHTAKAKRGGNVVYLEGGPLHQKLAVFLETEREAHALMDSLHLGAGHTTARFRALPPWAKHVRWLAIILTTSPWILLNFLRFLPGWALALIGVGYGVVILPAVLPQRVEVGQDGIFLRWLGNRRFIPFTRIEDAVATPLGVDLLLRGGKKIEIRLTQKDDGAAVERSALLEKIRAGLELGEGATRADEESMLAKGSRDVETWVREMQALGAGEAGGYRAMAIPRERLWDIVESPSADPSAREGAALALHADLDEDERNRLVALAHRTASPRLRVALDGVSRERDAVRLRVALETAEQEIEEPLSGSVRAARAANVRAGEHR